jgi:hypothetical protein
MKTEYKKFVFGETLQKAVAQIPESEQLRFYRIIVNYGIDGLEPELNGFEAAVWVQMKDMIDNTMPKKRGAPEGNGNAKKAPEGNGNAPEGPENNSDRIVSAETNKSILSELILKNNSDQIETNAPNISINLNENLNVNENVNENENLKGYFSFFDFPPKEENGLPLEKPIPEPPQKSSKTREEGPGEAQNEKTQLDTAEGEKTAQEAARTKSRDSAIESPDVYPASPPATAQGPPDPEDRPIERREDATTLWNMARQYWNKRDLKPECRDLVMRPADTPEILRTFQYYAWKEIENAIGNYAWHKIKAGPEYRPPPPYGSLAGFLKTGVEKYFDDDAFIQQFKEKRE